MNSRLLAAAMVAVVHSSTVARGFAYPKDMLLGEHISKQYKYDKNYQKEWRSVSRQKTIALRRELKSMYKSPGVGLEAQKSAAEGEATAMGSTTGSQLSGTESAGSAGGTKTDTEFSKAGNLSSEGRSLTHTQPIVG